MRKLLAAVCLLLTVSGAHAQTGSVKTQAALNTEIGTTGCALPTCLYPDSPAGSITAFGLRQGLLDLTATMFSGGGVPVNGPATTTSGDFAAWDNATGTLLKDVAPGAGVSAAFILPVNATGGLLTYAIIGTSGATVPLNNGGFTQSGTVNFTGTFELGGTTVTLPVSVPNGGLGVTTLAAGKPLFGAGTAAITTGTLSGNTTVLATTTGSLTNGHCVAIDSSGNLIDAGGACTTGGGGGTVASATGGQLAYYATSGTTVAGLTLGTGLSITGTTLNVTNGGVTSVGGAAGAILLGTGLTISGQTINSPWSISGSNIFNNNAGNVGIGTVTPLALLHVGAGTQTPFPTGNGIISEASGQSWVSARDTGNSAEVGLLTSGGVGYLGTWTNHPLSIRTNNADRIRIDTSGNVGIGTTSPGGILQVLGEVIAAPIDCTGTNPSQTSLTNAFAQGAHVILPAAAGGAVCTYRISANTAIANGTVLDVEPGAILAPDSGVTLTIHGLVHSGVCPYNGSSRPCQIFAGAGSVVGIRKVYPEWWGAYGDATHDDEPAINAAFLSMTNSATQNSDGNEGKIAFQCNAAYLINTNFVVTVPMWEPIDVAGCGGNGPPTKLVGGSGLSGSAGGVLQFVEASTSPQVIVHDLTIFGSGTSSGYCGLLFGGDGYNFGDAQEGISRIQTVAIANMSYGQICFINAQAFTVRNSNFFTAANGQNGAVLRTGSGGNFGTLEIEFDDDQFRNCNYAGPGNCDADGANIRIESSSSYSHGVTAVYVKSSYLYPFTGQCVNTLSGYKVQDLWFDSNQADSQYGTSACYLFGTAGSGVIDDFHILNSYWTVQTGVTPTTLPAWFYSPNGTNLNYLFVTGNYLITANSCSGTIAASGKQLTFTGNQFIGDCGSGAASSKIYVGGTSGAPSSQVIIESNSSTNAGATPSQYFAYIDNYVTGGIISGNLAYGDTTVGMAFINGGSPFVITSANCDAIACP